MMVVWVRVVNVRGNKKCQIRVELTGVTVLRCEYEGEMLNIMPNFYSWMSGWMVVSFTKIENSM